VNGLCVGTRDGGTSAGAVVELQGCSGAATQKWTATVVSGTTTTPAPAPAPAATTAPAATGGTAAVVFDLVGATVPPVPTQEARGGAWATYERDFRTFAETHWSASGADWGLGNYYDRAMIYYVWWARTGNATYLSRANAMALDYRTRYIESSNYGPAAWWAQMDGIALHYLVTGDEQSRTTVGRVADYFYLASGTLSTFASTDLDQRDQARMLLGFLLAWKLNAPSQYGLNWSTMLRTALTNVLSTQAPDGAYRVPTAQCGYDKPFMVGMLNDVLTRYYDTFERDPRIVSSVKRSVDYLWANDWLPEAQSFAYIGGPCYGEGRVAAGDLNNMISSGFGWVAKRTGDASYYTKGDAVFAGGVYGSWLFGSKQFNQAYASSFRYLGYRF
jgi:hypothetical protein